MEAELKKELIIDTTVTFCAQLINGGFEEAALYIRTEFLMSGIQNDYFTEEDWNNMVTLNMERSQGPQSDFSRLLF